MTARMPFRPGDDAVRNAVAPLLSELRTELLVLPRERVVEQHLDMMTFEQQVVATPRVARRPRPAMRRPRPRRPAFVIACICATIASCGLSAAGALPEPLQHLTDSIARTLGVPEPHDATPSTNSGARAPAAAHTVPDTTSPASAATPPSTTSHAPSTTHARTHAHTPSRTPAAHAPQPPATHVTPAPTPPIFPARPTEPSKRITPKPHQPPSKNSENTPPGYPLNWRDRATDAAANRLQACTQADVLDPADCPQRAVAYGTHAQAENVHWTLVGDPRLTAAAVAETTKSPQGTPTTVVTVYERFQMAATYTEPGGDRSYLAYSAGIAEATMTWSGSSFEVSLASDSVAGHVQPGVTVPGFDRSDSVWDASVLLTVESAFEQCTATSGPADPSSCPVGGLLDTPSAAQSTLDADPISAATLTFDRALGLYTVTGSYSMTPSGGTPVSGAYRATAFWDGNRVQILSVVAT